MGRIVSREMNIPPRTIRAISQREGIKWKRGPSVSRDDRMRCKEDFKDLNRGETVSLWG